MKKLLLSVLCLVMCLAALCVFTESAALAAPAVVDSGNCGTNVKWSLDSDGVLTVSGTGDMADYEFYAAAPWYTHVDSIKKLVIKSGVTSIGNYAFSYCNMLSEVSIPSGVTSIGDRAFYGCFDLLEVTIPGSVKTMGATAFYGCSDLVKVTIENGVTSISDYAFYSCYSLREISIPASVTSVGEGAFDECTALTDVIYYGTKSQWDDISIGMYNGCLTDAEISYGGACGDNVSWALRPDGTLSINGTGAMYDFVNTTDSPWHEDDLRNNIKNVVIGNGVTYIGKNAFADCTLLRSVTIPTSVTAIGNTAFMACENLTGVTIPSSVKTIGDGAFMQCADLTAVNIPSSVTYIGENAFYMCLSLTRATVSGGISAVKDSTFGECKALTSVTLPNTVKAIGEGAFYKCASLVSVNLPKGVETIEDEAFYMCTSLKEITLPVTVKSIESYSFGKCTSLTDVYYGGTEAQKNAIDMDVFANDYLNYDYLNHAVWHYAKVLKITEQPESITVAEGKSAKVTVSAEGDGLEYYWYFKNKGATKFSYTSSYKTSSYSIAMNSSRDGRQVYCVVTDKYGNSVKSETVTLSMAVPVKITTQPASVTVAEGAKATVTVKATGDGLKYYWYFKNPDATKFSYTSTFTGNTYSVSMNSARSGRQVYCYVVDKYGNSVKSSTVTLKTGNFAKITAQPNSVTVAEGKTAKVTVKAAGEGLTYKWYFKNKGAAKFSYTSAYKTASYSVPMDAARDGRRVYCVITDKYGNSVTTNTVTLNMEHYAKITTQPKSVTVTAGSKATVTVKAAGDGLKYYWYFKNPGASKFSYTSSFTGNTYSVALAKERSGRQVCCYVVDKYGNTVKSNTVTLTVGNAAKITTHPKSVTVTAGAKATVKVTATGDGLTYKWYFKNPDASKFSYTSTFTGNTYSVALAANRSGRQVYCVVTDKYGNSVKSNTVTLYTK